MRSHLIWHLAPIYHKRDETIRGHVFCSFLALVLKQELESRMKRTGSGANFKKGRRADPGALGERESLDESDPETMAVIRETSQTNQSR